MQKYAVNQYLVNNILGWVESGEIAIPEIQRPFVWSSIKVRDLMDSLYNGYPIGYIIAWKNPNIRLKDGSISSGKKILIDGQQRITALRAAVLGENIVDMEYKETKINIAFNPLTEEFATLTPALNKDPHWISDISEFLKKDVGRFGFLKNYCEKNPEVNQDVIEKNIDKLIDIKNKQVGFIELAEDLDIETVTEIFIRINSKGMVLSQADFAMSKIASHGDFGVNLRKLIDYFCHLSREPKFYKHISENDIEFSKTQYLSKIEWLKNENDELYDPDYTDVIRVSFTEKFNRGKLSDLVSLLSGRNFETKTYEEEIVQDSFNKMEDAILNFVNQAHFQRFLMIIKSTGFINKSLINSQNVINFSYALYLKLRELKIDNEIIEKMVRKWFVMATLTGRYSASPESMFDLDIKNVQKQGVEKYLSSIEQSGLSDTFWNVTLVQELDKASISNPLLNVFFASQIYFNDEGFLSSDIKVRDMITHRGDIHHLFPKEYLREKYNSRSDYNQIANFVYAQAEINVKIGKKSPKEYMQEVLQQTKDKKIRYGNILDEEELKNNLHKNCVPELVFNMEINDYMNFLEDRKKLMAKKIEKYYKSL